MYWYTGYYTGSEDYFLHLKPCPVDNTTVIGYDFHRDVGDDLKPAWEYYEQYSTFVFTKEAQKILEQVDVGDKVKFLCYSLKLLKDC